MALVERAEGFSPAGLLVPRVRRQAEALGYLYEARLHGLMVSRI